MATPHLQYYLLPVPERDAWFVLWRLVIYRTTYYQSPNVMPGLYCGGSTFTVLLTPVSERDAWSVLWRLVIYSTTYYQSLNVMPGLYCGGSSRTVLLTTSH